MFKLKVALGRHRGGSVLCLKFELGLEKGEEDPEQDLWTERAGEDALVHRELRAVLRWHGGGVLDMRIDERYIVSCSKDAAIRVWARDTLALHCTLRGHEGPVNAMGLQSGNASERIAPRGTASAIAGASHDIIGNYFIAGPSTTSAGDDYFQMNANQDVFASGDFLDSNVDGVLNGAAANTVGSAAVLSSPWNSGSTGLATLTAAEARHSRVWLLSLGTRGAIITDQASTGLSNNGFGTL
ncbi:hypothetical protein DFH07DRAFT_1062639 [Mycena maculata]|uniref:WD40 repeat-like protein n=1 Tax=Mycena maculata TaxID=230809 RepID=A0AAD7N6M5_9AGAR|nr:hypothetical protein DFH07DRAFT_1062639 [Mycena maculata]